MSHQGGNARHPFGMRKRHAGTHSGAKPEPQHLFLHLLKSKALGGVGRGLVDPAGRVECKGVREGLSSAIVLSKVGMGWVSSDDII